MLTASLRIQTNPENEKDFEGISHERLVVSEDRRSEGRLLADMILYRAFADFVFGSMILHFFCVNFIN